MVLVLVVVVVVVVVSAPDSISEKEKVNNGTLGWAGVIYAPLWPKEGKHRTTAARKGHSQKDMWTFLAKEGIDTPSAYSSQLTHKGKQQEHCIRET